MLEERVSAVDRCMILRLRMKTDVSYFTVVPAVKKTVKTSRKCGKTRTIDEKLRQNIV